MEEVVSITGKTCPLRKPCYICGRPFGRKLHVSGRGKGHFASVKNFQKTRTCGRSCGAILAARTRQEDHSRKSASAPAADRAMLVFIGVGR